MPFRWFGRKHGPRETERGTGCYVAQSNIVGYSDGAPPEPPAPLIDKATKIANIAEEMSTPWTLSRRELVRRDELLDKIRNRITLTEGERSELEALLRKKELGES